MSDYQQEIIENALPLDREKLTPLIDSLKNKKIVMLGEASHGTKEFYEWRQYITQELVMNHGFNFVAVEGDWPPCQKVNQFLRSDNKLKSEDVLASFNRWPTWMWANTEVLWFIDWLKEWNRNNPVQVGFHGLDVYSLFESMDQVVLILNKIDPALAEAVQKKYACLESYRHNEKAYAKSLLKAPEGCQREVIAALNATLRENIKPGSDHEAWLDVKQNAQIVKNAENYYRAMVFGDEDSWNVRDEHMMSTLSKLLEHYGPDSKSIVWEHNTHIGDYRATNMINNGQVNIGGLAREIFGRENVGLVGFGTYVGSVTASYAWDGPTISFDVPEAPEGSVEFACHDAISEIGCSDFYLLFDPTNHHSALTQVKGHRAIGVVYDPMLEFRGNYVPTSLANRYDGFIFLNRTHSLTPLKASFDVHKFPESYPYGTRV